MGKFSRDKGARGERALVDFLKNRGSNAMRIPLSGAMKGFKCDVTSDLGTFEVKTRKNAFSSIYAFYESHSALYENSTTLRFAYKDELISIGSDPFVMPLGSQLYVHLPEAFNRVIERIAKMKKLKQEADFLAIRDDRKYFIFIRYV